MTDVSKSEWFSTDWKCSAYSSRILTLSEQGAVGRAYWNGTRFFRSLQGRKSLVGGLEVMTIGSCLQLNRVGFPPLILHVP